MTNRPAVSIQQWLWLNIKIGALSFGSSGRLFMYEEGVVFEQRWLSEEEFRRIFLMTQVLPGPNLVNLCVYLGFELQGFWGAFVGLLALTLPGALLALALIFFVDLNQPHIARLFEGFSLASVAMFSIFVYRMVKGLAYSRDSTEQRRLKVSARFAIAVAVASASMASVPLVWTLLGGFLAGFAVEIFL